MVHGDHVRRQHRLLAALPSLDRLLQALAPGHRRRARAHRNVTQALRDTLAERAAARDRRTAMACRSRIAPACWKTRATTAWRRTRLSTT